MSYLALILIMIIVFFLTYRCNIQETFINMHNINMYSNGKQIVRSTHRNLKKKVKGHFYNIKGTVNRKLREAFLN